MGFVFVDQAISSSLAAEHFVFVVASIISYWSFVVR